MMPTGQPNGPWEMAGECADWGGCKPAFTLDRRHEIILRSTRLNNSPAAVAGIRLVTSFYESKGFQKGYIAPHGFAIAPERPSKLRDGHRPRANSVQHPHSLC